MCGFIAGYNPNGWNTDHVQQSVNLLLHRGPDGHNTTFIDPAHFLSHTRLSIVGVSNGQQPLHFQGLHAVVNGEFYDYAILRSNLEKKGFVFQTQTDSELLLYLYVLYEERCLEYLHGEFSFVLYDQPRDRWFAARDRFGIRPLHWTQPTPNGICFASEAKAFKPFKRLQLDRESLWFSQHFQYLPQGRTLFEGVYLLPPGHFAFFQKGQWFEHSYFSLTNTTTNDSLTTAQERLMTLLENAVSRRIPQEVPACVHLSAGIDSSSIAALAQPHAIRDAFTISFIDDPFYNEIIRARETAQFLGLNLHEIPVSTSELLEALPQALYHAEGLAINGHLSAKHLLSKAIQNAGFKVALSGEGSDEILMGYSHLKQDYLSAQALRPMETHYLTGVQLPCGTGLDLHMIDSELGFTPTWLLAKSSMASKLSSLWHSDFLQASPNALMVQQLRNNPSPYASRLKTSSFHWMRFCLAGYILKVLDDAQAMAFSIEGRHPFLDTDLVQYVLSWPDSYYFDQHIEKTLLRKAMQNRLPQSILNQPKQSFMSSPFTHALVKPGFKDRVHAILSNDAFLNAHLFDAVAVQRALIQWEQSPSTNNDPLLMTLLSIAGLCEQFSL